MCERSESDLWETENGQRARDGQIEPDSWAGREAVRTAENALDVGARGAATDVARARAFASAAGRRASSTAVTNWPTKLSSPTRCNVRQDVEEHVLPQLVRADHRAGSIDVVLTSVFPSRSVWRQQPEDAPAVSGLAGVLFAINRSDAVANR